MKNNKIIFADIYDISEIKAQLPWNAQLRYNISVETYGFVHDVGMWIVLTPNHEGYGKGWHSWERDFHEAVKHCEWSWKLNDEFGYH